jgi:hypothetical protein
VKNLLAIGMAAMLAGCAAQTYEGGRFAQAGQATLGPDRVVGFKRDAAFKQPSNFTVSPEDVAAKFGHLCKAKKGCAYFADSRAYYLVADYGQPEAKNGSISQIACPVVDGASGSLLKIC